MKPEEKKNEDQHSSRLSMILDGDVWRLLNSKIAILFLGALVTGIGLFLYQQKEKRLEWQAQTRYTNLRFSLEKMKTCQEEFFAMKGYLNEAEYLVRPFLNQKEIDEQFLRKLDSEIEKLESAALRQHTNVAALVSGYFRAPRTIHDEIEDYRDGLLEYLRNIRAFVESKRQKHNDKELMAKIQTLSDIEEIYNGAKRAIQRELVAATRQMEKQAGTPQIGGAHR